MTALEQWPERGVPENPGAWLGRIDGAREEFLRAAELTRNAREKSALVARAEDCARRTR